MNTFSTWLAAFMLVLFATMILIAMQYPPGARFMPLVIGIPATALCILQLALDALRAPGGRFAMYRFRTAPKAGKRAEAEPDEEFGPQTVAAEATMFAYFIAFIAGVLLFGFYASVPVMLVAFLRREAGTTWRLALSLGVGATLAIYLLFAVVLRIVLHEGFVTPAISNALGL